MRPTVRLTVNVGVVVILALTLWFGISEAARLSGQLINQDSGRPIAGATIIVEGTDIRAISDSSGQFSLGPLPDGEYTIRVIHSDFGSHTIAGIVVSGDKSSFAITASSQFQVWQIAEQLKEEISAGRKIVAFRDIISVPERERNGKVSGDLLKPGDRDETARTDDKNQNAAENPAPLNSGQYAFNSLAKKPSTQRRVKVGDIQNDNRPQPPVTAPLPYGGYIPEVDALMYSQPTDMYFRDYGTNRFIDPRHDRFSTFALDVDDASYGIAAKYLRDGHLPPAAAIRPEEFINHFDYGYNSPKNGVFRVFTEMTQSPFDPSISIFKIGIKGKEIKTSERKPLRLTLVIDVSGSMSGGGRLSLAKESLRMLIRRLDSRDKVGIVMYNTNATNVLHPVSANRTTEIEQAISMLYPGGSTNAEAGLTLGFQMANRQYSKSAMNRVILISDGVANVGNTSSGGIMSRIEQFARKGITLSAFGVGMGNYNDVLLEQLAQKGDGNYAYINSSDDARRLFVDEVIDNFQLLARDTKVQVEFNPSVVSSYRLIGYENRKVADNRFRDNSQDGGEIGPGHEITAVYEIVLSNNRSKGKLATVHVRWTNPGETQVTELSRDAFIGRNWKKLSAIRPELRLALVASRFSELLKGTSYVSETSYNDLLQVADPLRQQMGGKQVDDLLDLIRRARALSTFHTVIDDGNYIREF